MKYFCPIIKNTLYLYRVRVKVKGLSVLPAALFYFLLLYQTSTLNTWHTKKNHQYNKVHQWFNYFLQPVSII